MENNVSAQNELQPDTTLNGGKYVIEKKIGDGGFGIAYRAKQAVLNRTVCIKEYFLSGYCVRNTQDVTVHFQGIDADFFEKYRKAFVKEAQILAKLHHPGVVEVIDIFDENNTSYMVMPFIEGPSLQSIVEQKGPMSYPEAVNYMAQIAGAVGYIHDHHILHRDIKPNNILITSDYKAVLIDFGSAREYIEDKTQAFTSMVSHGYAPPEQYTRTSRKGSYTDIYALGATLYFVLTGKEPLEAAARLTEELVEPRKLNPSIPLEGNRTILKAMRLKREERYQSVWDFLDDLRNTNQVTMAGRPAAVFSKDNTFRQNSRKRRVLWLALAVLLLIGTTFVAYRIVHRKSVETEMAYVSDLEQRYNAALEQFERECAFISQDAEGDVGEKDHVTDALKALKTIEQCEKDVSFSKLGKESVFEDKLLQYRAALLGTKAVILEENQKAFDCGDDDPYTVMMRDRCVFIDHVLEQTNGNSVTEIKL